METRAPTPPHPALVYSPMARAFHWITVAVIAVQLPVGLYMVWRGNNVAFDATTNWLYNAHKLVGFLILWLIAARLLYRLVHGAPADEPTLEWWQKAAAHATHWGLYVLLMVLPILGWVGVSYYGARGTFGGFSLPALVGEDKAAAETILALHKWAAYVLIAMLGAHIAAAIYHHAIRGDGVLRRMLPGLRQR